MRSRRFRLALLLTVLVGVASCEINPQPGLPGTEAKGPNAPGAAGALNLGEGMGGSQPAPSAGGTSDDSANGGTLAIGVGGDGDAPGAAGAGVPSDGGAGGATDAGGAGGAAGALEPGPQ